MPGHAPRPLDRAERSVLDLLLSAEFPGVVALREQARSVVVVGGCRCGCPSIALDVVNPAPVAPPLPSRLAPYHGRVRPAGSEASGEIILFVDGGRLSYLEYVYYDDPPARWPSPDRIELVG